MIYYIKDELLKQTLQTLALATHPSISYNNVAKLLQDLQELNPVKEKEDKNETTTTKSS